MIHFAFSAVNDGSDDIYLKFFFDFFYGFNYIRKSAYARRFDNYSVGVKFFDHFFHGRREITHKRTADAARIYFLDFDSAFFQKSTVYADFAEFVFY